MPGSLSQINRRGTRPSCWISSHEPEQQILGLAGREHPPGDEPRVRRDDDQHRQQRARRRPPAGSSSAGTTDRTAPASPGMPDQPVGRIEAADSEAAAAGRCPEPGDRPRPLDPLGDHRRRHLRMLGQQLPAPAPRTARTTSPPPPAHTSAAGPRPPPGPPSPARSPTPERPAAAEHRPQRAAGSTPSPPPRSPIQSVWVASFSTVAMASFSSVVDTRSHRHLRRSPWRHVRISGQQGSRPNASRGPAF